MATEQVPTKAQAEVLEHVWMLPVGHYVAPWACRPGQSWKPAMACVRRGWLERMNDGLISGLTREGLLALKRWRDQQTPDQERTDGK